MKGLLQGAWEGWQGYICDGKLAALFLAALLYLLAGRKGGCRSFVLYAVLMTVCCILPVTAVVLMTYQTGFYEYVYIWGLVPVTAVTAYGITVVLAEGWADFKPSGWRRGVPVAALLLAAVLFSSGLGGGDWDRPGEGRERRQAYEVLGRIVEMCPDREICLWAPRGILEYAREKDAAIRLAYGRDMWNSTLVGYTYDVYDQKKISMYQWMEMNPEERTQEMNELAAALALEAGVNCVLLPRDTDMGIVWYMGDALEAEVRLVGNYFFLVRREA